MTYETKGEITSTTILHNDGEIKLWHIRKHACAHSQRLPLSLAESYEMTVNRNGMILVSLQVQKYIKGN